MGKTIIEKIIANHSDEEVEPGRIVWMRIDVRTARDFGGPNVVKHLRKHYGKDMVDDPTSTYFTFDTCAPAKTIAYAKNQHLCRQFAKETGVGLYDVDMGIGTHVGCLLYTSPSPRD